MSADGKSLALKPFSGGVSYGGLGGEAEPQTLVASKEPVLPHGGGGKYS